MAGRLIDDIVVKTPTTIARALPPKQDDRVTIDPYSSLIRVCIGGKNCGRRRSVALNQHQSTVNSATYTLLRLHRVRMWSLVGRVADQR